MKVLVFKKKNNLNLIGEELFDAFPEWVREETDPDLGTTINTTSVVIQHTGNKDEFSVTVPDDADEVAIQAVVDAHDSSKESKKEKRDKKSIELKELARVKIIAAAGLTDDEYDAVF
jgi:hypothetical protein